MRDPLWSFVCAMLVFAAGLTTIFVAAAAALRALGL
jgi:hypothetical protein